ncbi:MAG TPA: hypothetical protein VGD62_10615 [Acidobacteriaceae bacterium]
MRNNRAPQPGSMPVSMRGRLTVLSLTAAAMLATGCETGRTNKAHAEWQHVSDETTTSKPASHQALGAGDHQPPVPGSPTAAGPDGNQPPDDMQARSRHDSEHGQAPAPFAQPADSRERH